MNKEKKLDSRTKKTSRRTQKTDSQSVQKAAMGKCPMRFLEKDNKIFDMAFKNPTSSVEDAHIILQHLTSTQDVDLATEIFDRGTAAMPNTHSISKKMNAVLQSLADKSPKDAIEAKLCMQETALYAQGMQYLSRAENCNGFEQNEFYIKNAIKLLRLHNETIETMMKYKRDGEQHVVVQHVNVNTGGQAIVGGILKGGGQNTKNDEVIP